jgi:KaiC/GvpD/RAD55 family RecA-like ATPase
MTNTTLYILPSVRYFENIVKIFRKLEKKNVIYVTTNKPYKHLTALFKKNNVDTKRMFFIDCISQQVGAAKDQKNCIFLAGPEQITHLSIAVSQAIKKVPGDKVFFFDSLSTLLIYNSEKVIGQFSNFIINSMRAKNVSSVLLALESDADKKVITAVKSFVDEVKTNA